MGRTHSPLSCGAACALVVAAACSPASFPFDYAATQRTPAPLRALDAADIVVPVVPEGEAELSGVVKNWFSLAAVEGATLRTYGLAAEAEGSANGTGEYTLTVQAAGVFWAVAYGEGYARTYDLVRMPAGNYTKTLYTVPESQLEAVARAHGVTRNPACATVIGEVRTTANQGVAGLREVTLVGASYRGPYFLDEQNQPEAGRNESASTGRVVFLNVCDIQAESLTSGLDLQITVLDARYVARPQLLKVFPGYVTRGLVEVSALPDPNAPPPDPGAPPAPPVPTPEPDPNELVLVDFAQDIYPIFVNNACAACHTEGGVAGATGLYFDKPPEQLYTDLRDGARVNLAEPEASTVLLRPLLEVPPDHPNASFESVLAPDYVKLLQWIHQGAPYGVEEPPPPVEPVTFTDVYATLQSYDAERYPYGRGCADCHNATLLSGGLDVTGGEALAYQSIVDNNGYNLNYPERSSLLRNPYCGTNKCLQDEYPEIHPTEVFANTDDPDYQKIYQWIAQGAPFEAPVEPPPPELPVDVDFFREVQPRFAQRGCVGCHDAVSYRGGLNLTGTPGQVYERLMAPGEERVVPGDVPASGLYTRPHAGYPEVTHTGGKPVPNDDDPFARAVAGWIAGGAPFVAPPPVSFEDDIVPLLGPNGLGCTGCHNQALASGGLSLEGSPAQIYAELMEEEERVIAGKPEESPLVQKAFDLYPAVAHGGGKMPLQAYYREYHWIATWIFEGATP